jgi:hypothetical protein
MVWRNTLWDLILDRFEDLKMGVTSKRSLSSEHLVHDHTGSLNVYLGVKSTMVLT